ncbi:Ger(x)C family spore germination protein [Dethiothermospora halolimnae]|uniref:Ger(x)C family spore germination protein n=1 Tax=Dethiothermospora halolimnae TaxID=3114390 RepID=UPI003CCC3089
MKHIKPIILLIIILSLTGCWDKKELEEQAFVIAIGLDTLDGDGISITYQIANPQSGGGGTIGQSDKEKPFEVITVKAPGPMAGKDMANASITREITFSHTQVLVVSEKLAKKDKAFSILDAMVRDRQVRRNTTIIVSKEKASEFINLTNSPLETRPHKYYSLISQRWRDTAFVGYSNINDFIVKTEGDAGLYLSVYGTTINVSDKNKNNEDQYLAGEIPREGGGTGELIGSAVFKEGKMIGTLTGEETRISLILQPNYRMEKIITTYDDPLNDKYKITTRVGKYEDTIIDINVDSSTPIINVKVPLIFDILAIPSGIDYIEDLDKQKLLISSIEKTLNKKTKKLIKMTQEKFNGEPFGWSIEVRKKFSTWDEYTKYNWMKNYPQADITVNYDIILRGIGKELSPANIDKIKD